MQIVDLCGQIDELVRALERTNKSRSAYANTLRNRDHQLGLMAEGRDKARAKAERYRAALGDVYHALQEHGVHLTDLAPTLSRHGVDPAELGGEG